MELGTLVEWRVQEGASFASSTVLAEVGTDKANMDAEIFDSGVLIKHLVAEGDEIPPGFPIAIWGESADEDVSALLAEFETRKDALSAPPAAAQPADASRDDAPPPARDVAAPPPPPAAAPTSDVSRTWMDQSLDTSFMDPPGDLLFGGVAQGRVHASPLARKVAEERGVDLRGVQGSGPGGRIVVADVDGAPHAGSRGPSLARGADETVKHSPMRKTIARRLLASHQDIPTFYLTAELDMAPFVQARATLKVGLPDTKISYNDMLILAVARALREHPQVNASWSDQAVQRHGRVDIGVAVAIPDGLITPVVRSADLKSLPQVATEVRELAGRAKAQRLSPEEYTGSTFTISNLGMMGIQEFTAIINPPEAAILAVGTIDQVPRVVDGELIAGWRMMVTLTCDHRVIDGATGAAFLQSVRKYVENPLLLFI